MKVDTFPFPKLPEEFKEKWVAALRSGDYHQTTNVLVDDDFPEDKEYPAGYCCLGVACKVAGHDNSIIRYHETIPDGLKNVPDILTGEPEDNMLVDKLTRMNDAQGLSFNDIAEYIELNL